jgi:hypothetical protein
MGSSPLPAEHWVNKNRSANSYGFRLIKNTSGFIALTVIAR